MKEHPQFFRIPRDAQLSGLFGCNASQVLAQHRRAQGFARTPTPDRR
jgi:hypothetical protein